MSSYKTTNFTLPTDDAIVAVNNLQFLSVSQNVNTTQFVSKTYITSAQLLSLFALQTALTPLVLLPAPGAGLLYNINKVLFSYVYNTTPYTVVNAGVYSIKTNNIILGGNTYAANTFLTAANSLIWAAENVGTVTVTNPTNLVNQPVVFINGGTADPLAGDGTLNITLWGEIVVL